MYNNKSLLNKVLRDYNSKCQYNSSKTKFLTPCEILNKYMNDPCSIFNENIVPIDPMNPAPPMPPIPPMPPMPPGPRLDHAIFRAAGVLDDGDVYPLVPEVIVGDTIKFSPVARAFILAPGREYAFSWRTETFVNMMPFLVAASIFPGNGEEIVASRAEATMTTRPGIVDLSKSGRISTQAIAFERSFIFVFFSTIGPLPTSAIFDIEVLP